MNDIKGVIWDLGGVIVRDNLQSSFIENGVPYNDRVKVAWKNLRLGLIDDITFYKESLSGTPYEHLTEVIRKKGDELIQLQEDGALPLVKEVFALKNYQQGIISNHSSRWGKEIVERWNLDALMNLIVISADVHLDKSTRTIFDYTLSGMQLKPTSYLY